MIRLFTSAFPESSEARRAEYAEALRRNLACAPIGEVCVLVEPGAMTLPLSPKLRTKAIDKRPRYDDFFDWAGEMAGGDDVSVVANADIHFDNGIALLDPWPVPERTVLALARWDVRGNGSAELYDRNDSQDAWIFRDLPRVNGDFPVGVPRCDNRIARELQLAGYTVINPSFSIRAYHLHAEPERSYDVEHREGFVPPPYAYVWPHNLWSLPRTLAHNAAYPDARAGWRIDTRLLRRAFKVHRFEKGMRTVLSAAGIGREKN